MIHRTPQPGDIGLVSIQGPVGALIRVGQWLNADGFGVYEHAFVVLDDGTLIEAMPGGARIVGLDEYAGAQPLYVSPAGLTDAERTLVCETARAYEGVGYGWLDYAALAAHRFHLPVPGLRRWIGSSHRLICSELADAAYADAGVQLFDDGRWPGYVTPMALFDLLAKEDR